MGAATLHENVYWLAYNVIQSLARADLDASSQVTIRS